MRPVIGAALIAAGVFVLIAATTGSRGDDVDCGPGTDTVFFDDPGDTIIDCENLNPPQ